MSFENKIVLVTGGSSGIGAATAISFTKAGASVAIVGRNETKLNRVSLHCQEHGGIPFIIKADVSKDEEASLIVKKTIDRFGKLDILVNNAGIVDTGGLLDGDILKSYDKVMSTNLRAVVLITSLAVPHLVKTKGNIVNVSSILGTVMSPRMMSYCVSKAGLDHFSRGAAFELAPSGVRVNIVSPGPAVTDILENAGLPDKWEDLAQHAPLGKVTYPEEIADLILFLASNKAKSITRANFTIDNGLLLKL